MISLEKLEKAMYLGTLGEQVAIKSEKAFESFQLGYASAIAIILAIIIFVITFINFKMQDKWVKTIE